MKEYTKHGLRVSLGVAVAGAVFGMARAATTAEAQEESGVVVSATATAGADNDPKPKTVEKQRRIVIQDLEPAGGESSRREVAWLGLATEESSEALASQLGLQPGEGLVVVYVAPDSPASKAEFQKNDLLVELDGQTLVHPAQLRKLVQMRKENDRVKLGYYRAGKKDTVSVKLGKTTTGGSVWPGTFDWQGSLRDLQQRLRDLPSAERIGPEMRRLRENLAQLGIDKESVQVEIKRSVAEARKAIDEALRHSTNAGNHFGPAVKEMREIIRRGVDVDKDATIIVKRRGNDVRTMVKTDDSGTYVVVADPKKRLTAHDKSGKLTFDGEIETDEQQEKVPKEVWEKVKPMLEQLQKDGPKGPGPEPEESDV